MKIDGLTTITKATKKVKVITIKIHISFFTDRENYPKFLMEPQKTKHSKPKQP